MNEDRSFHASMAQHSVGHQGATLRGRGATLNPASRFDVTATEVFDDGWGLEPVADSPAPATVVVAERARSILSRNRSPDIPFELSINPYKGCEHGCVYCYARPSHGYLGLSPGLDFETKIFSKPQAAKLLRRELARQARSPGVIALGGNTDPYQPAERQLEITRELIEVMAEHRQPFVIITKAAGVQRDLDLLAPLGRAGLCRVMVSLTSLQPDLSRLLEPRASHPKARLAAIEALASAGVPTGVMAAPMIPAINDMELDTLLEAAALAGAASAAMVLIRLPHEVKELFEDWLQRHFPERKQKVLSLIRQTRGGKLYDARFSQRLRGTGVYANLLQQRFDAARRRHGLDVAAVRLDTSQFRRPPQAGEQLGLL